VRDYSEEIAAAIDEEVRALIEQAHQEAYEVLFDNRDILDRLVVELLEKETLDKEQVADIFSDIRRRDARPAWTGSARRRPHERGPVDFRDANNNGAGLHLPEQQL
jgi:cell division protease FtsH